MTKSNYGSREPIYIQIPSPAKLLFGHLFTPSYWIVARRWLWVACSFNKARNSHRIIYDYRWDSHSPCTCTNSCCPAECNRYSKEDNASSIFHIFERLNTGGTPFKPQEIRNCVY